MINKIINDEDFILKKKEISLNEINIPPLIILKKLININYSKPINTALRN